jgi:hypothetical protein
MAQNIYLHVSHMVAMRMTTVATYSLFLGIPWLVKQGMCHMMTFTRKNYLLWSSFQKSSLGLCTKTASLSWISESNGQLRKRQSLRGQSPFEASVLYNESQHHIPPYKGRANK